MQYKVDYMKSLLIKLFGAVIIYGIMLSQFLYNANDAIWTGTMYFGNDWELSLGRWAIRYFDIGQFGIHVHPWSSVITLLLFIIGTTLICDIFDVNPGSFWDFVVSFVFLSNSVVCVSLSYLYTSHVYGGAFLFASICLWLIKNITKNEDRLFAVKNIFLILLAAFCFSIMMGLYQAYIGVVSIIALAYLLVLVGKESVGFVKKYLVSGIIVGIVGGTLYKIILEIELTRYGVGLSSYQNADSWSFLDIVKNPRMAVRETYNVFFQYLRSDYPKWNMVPYKISILAICALALIVVVGTYLKRKNILDVAIIIIGLLVMPAIANIVMILIPNSGMQIQQCAPMAMIFPSLILIALNSEKFDLEWCNKTKQFLLTFFCIVLIWGSASQVNIDQETLRQCTNAGETLCNAIVSELAKEDLLGNNYKYVVVGSAKENPFVYINEAYNLSNNYARLFGNMRYGATDAAVWRGAFRNILGINLNICQGQEYEDIISNVEVEKMPAFPNSGYIQMINDVVVIRVSDYNIE